ncbi:MAG: DUF3794 domain-containing protein [Clostridiales bacterium]|nr:DUF3794 domain-containing protein [Clostridiales bacterium]
MELLKKTVKYYETVMEKSILHDESSDMIVSDAYPDFERIVGATGNVFIKDKAAQNGRVLISGVVKVTALCMPEDGSRIHRIEVPVNFAHMEDGNRITSNSLVSVEAQIRNIEPRMANPRKISVKAYIILKVSVYEASEREICYDIASEDHEKMQVLKNKYEASLAVDVKEKNFTIIEDMEIGSMSASQEICGHKISMINEETRLVKNKAIVKGTAQIRLMALNVGTSEMSNLDFRLPYSQILEMDGVDENCEISMTSHIKNADFVMNENDGGRKLQCMVSVEIFAVASSRQVINAVCDAYSTIYETNLETVPCAFTGPINKKERTVDVNEIITFDMPVRSVIDYSVALEAPEFYSDPEPSIKSMAYIAVLYKNGADEIISDTASVMVNYKEPMMNEYCGMKCECTALHLTPMPDGTMQVSMSVLFAVSDKDCVKIPHIRKVELNRDHKKEFNQNLSLLLTYMPGEESLWSLAKRYNTTAMQIAAANGFAPDERIPAGRMLLIPFER